MEERDWRILQVLSEEKSINKTAQILYISQPALTARLHQIEEDLGTIIVLRTSKGVRFTPQGEYIAEVAKSMLREYAQIRERVKTMGTTVSGTLRIAASQYMMKYILPEVLKRFKDLYPGAEFNLVSAWSREVYGIVRCQDAHVGFVLDSGEWEEEKHLLFEDPLCLVSTSEICFADLPELPRIEFRTNPSNKANIDKWWQSHFSKAPRICMEVDILDTCHEMVRHGLGYAILPKMIVEHDSKLHIELLRDKDGQPLARQGWMVYGKKSQGLPIVEHFVDFVKRSDVRLLQET